MTRPHEQVQAAEVHWGVRYISPYGQHITEMATEEDARRNQRYRPAPGCRHELVRCEVRRTGWETVDAPPEETP